MRRIASFLAGAYLILALAVGGLKFLGQPGSLNEMLSFGQPIVVKVLYSSEKKAWLEAANQRFAATKPTYQGRSIQVQLVASGSQEIANSAAVEQQKPVALSPASSSQLAALRAEWANLSQPDLLAGDQPPSLVLTPLVLVGWEERAKVLWPNGSDQDFWPRLHDLLTDKQGWQKFGQPTWGLAKFGQPSPKTSNSGQLSLALLAYAYHNKSNNLTKQDVANLGFQTWLDEIERSVTEFSENSANFMENIVLFGPSKYDFVLVYENLAIENIKKAKRWGGIRVFYPPACLFSDNPFGILAAPWVTPAQREAALLFRTFLLSPEMQTLALQAGFRPSDPFPTLNLADSQSPFTLFAKEGLQKDLNQTLEQPSPEVLQALTELWLSGNYKNR